VRDTGGHFTHGRQATDEREAFLQLACLFRGLAAGGDVLDEPRKARRLRAGYRPHGEEDGENASILAARFDFPTLPDDVGNACRRVAGQRLLMRSPVRLGHQGPDAPTKNLLGRVTEQAFRGSVEDLKAAQMIDENDAVDSGVQNRLELFRGLCAR